MAELKKIEAKQASEILTHFELSEEGAHCAEQATLPPADFLKNPFGGAAWQQKPVFRQTHRQRSKPR